MKWSALRGYSNYLLVNLPPFKLGAIPVELLAALVLTWVVASFEKWWASDIRFEVPKPAIEVRAEFS